MMKTKQVGEKIDLVRVYIVEIEEVFLLLWMMEVLETFFPFDFCSSRRRLEAEDIFPNGAEGIPGSFMPGFEERGSFGDFFAFDFCSSPWRLEAKDIFPNGDVEFRGDFGPGFEAKGAKRQKWNGAGEFRGFGIWARIRGKGAKGNRACLRKSSNKMRKVSFLQPHPDPHLPPTSQCNEAPLPV
ncbi:hypothetical protein CEXT_403161 [Caerostris extrusa]|uniref:Uncharacterized protein n=1 Tax=Caerostris extrusa TaxID=172846 RepID=A0AAV4XB24_CAEEX|nr:hypothetical protein CEXT_403161 [Caerostris extrusa]